MLEISLPNLLIVLAPIPQLIEAGLKPCKFKKKNTHSPNNSKDDSITMAKILNNYNYVKKQRCLNITNKALVPDLSSRPTLKFLIFLSIRQLTQLTLHQAPTILKISKRFLKHFKK